MNKFAVSHARERLKRARMAVAELRDPEKIRTVEDVQRIWFDFLLAANGIFVKLEKGAQNYPKTRGWWDRLKKRRKDDPLLSYLHQARRVEEHGLNRSSHWGAPHIEWVPDDYQVPEERRGKELVIELGPGGRRLKMIPPNSVQLVDVVDDQYGDVFPVPRSHLGKPFEAITIPDMADLALDTMEAIIGEAAALVPPDKHKPSSDKRPQAQG